MSGGPLVEIEDLRIAFPREDGEWTEVVKGVSYSLGREKLGIVGESGSGKSLSARALMGVLPSHARVQAQKLCFDGIDLLSASAQLRRRLRGGRMSMILQDPKFSLNPVIRVGSQIIEAIRIGNRTMSADACRRRALHMLETVHIREPERVLDLYPHQVSGGMGQRVMIAMMMAREPDLLVADEPTSALDVTVRNQVLSIMTELVERRGMGLRGGRPHGDGKAAGRRRRRLHGERARPLRPAAGRLPHRRSRPRPHHGGGRHGRRGRRLLP